MDKVNLPGVNHESLSRAKLDGVQLIVYRKNVKKQQVSLLLLSFK